MPNFYRLWIGAEAPLSMILREVTRRMVAQKIIGVILTIGEKMNFLNLDIKVHWVKKCKNFARLLDFLLSSRISISGLPGY